MYKRIMNLVIMCLFVLAILPLGGCFRVISDGEVGIRNTLGNYNDEELNTGFKLFIPVISFINIVNTKTQELTETMIMPTSEGLDVQVDVSVIYSIVPDRASEIKQTVTGDIKETLIIPYTRSIVRDIMAGYKAEEAYSTIGRANITRDAFNLMKKKLGENVIIEDVLLRKVVLPEKIKEAIQFKMDKKQELDRKEFELSTEKKNKEIEIIKAEAIAESNKIIAGSITEEYLKWKFIESLKDNGADVIYVPTEANLPIMEATRRS